jgi:hypothetical protein
VPVNGTQPIGGGEVPDGDRCESLNFLGQRITDVQNPYFAGGSNGSWRALQGPRFLLVLLGHGCSIMDHTTSAIPEDERQTTTGADQHAGSPGIASVPDHILLREAG